MSRADIKVGFACNNRCVFCAQGHKRRDVGFIDAKELADRMRKAFAPGRGLVLTGGEPTIRRDLVKLVALAHAIGYAPIQLQTNGRMLTYAPLVDRLMRAGVTEFSPALHGSTAAVHDALTGAPGSFDQTVAGMRNVARAGALLLTNTVVVRDNLGCLEDTIRLLGSLGVRQAQLALVHPVGTAGELYDQIVPPIDEAAEAMAGAIRAGRSLSMRVVTEAVPPCLLPGLEDAVVEERIPDTTVVDVDGELFGFSTWRADEGKAKGPRCGECTRNDRCEGPWREYPERFGWDAYRPMA
ncbi:MAG: radical SAM protein [Deltaproteobacteria bacterium]|nr:radical SAM protein [Deltaproteobacteria bacterium]